jgi:hypothetical protein
MVLLDEESWRHKLKANLAKLVDDIRDAEARQGTSSAAAAADAIARSWQSAMACGAPLSVLVSDVDDVVDHLLRFKAAAEALAAEETPRPVAA